MRPFGVFMYYLFNVEKQSVKAFSSLGDASRALLVECDVEINVSGNPVEQAKPLLGDSHGYAIMNISQAFASVSMSDDGIAQEMAKKLQEATDEFYTTKHPR